MSTRTDSDNENMAVCPHCGRRGGLRKLMDAHAFYGLRADGEPTGLLDTVSYDACQGYSCGLCGAEEIEPSDISDANGGMEVQRVE